MRLLLPLLIAAVAIPATALPAKQPPAKTQAKSKQKRQPDLADAVAGSYAGSVVADVKGSSGRQVVATVKRLAKNVVELSFDYARVPTVKITLERASDVILNASGHDNFLIEQAKDPRRLDLSIDGVTMILHKS